MAVRYSIAFVGHVQGVGFRYSATQVAARHPVTGWVRNEPDGSVSCVVEGQADDLEAFVEGVKSARAGHIDDVRIVESAATGEFTGFAVRY
ncbi:MAG: acylphosphatase [Planctomycetota bacterium]|jgi:acylphosphatase